MYLYIWQDRLGERGERRVRLGERGESQSRLREGGEKRAREGREWETGELYIYIIVYNCILYIYICINDKRDWKREERGERD